MSYLVVIKTHIVPENIGNIRIYDYAPKIFPSIPSRKGIKKAISRGEIIVDGQKTTTGTWIKAGQKIELLESLVNPPKEFKMKLEVVYEDDYFAIINKPSGISVSGNQFRTIQNALIGNIQLSDKEDALKWPKPVHRLDNPTSGLLIIAKTASALMILGQKFEKKEIQKTYQAIAIGKTSSEGMINEAIDGLTSSTSFRTINCVNSLKNKHLSLVELYPKTGRTHQLRIHLSKLGHPIMGDKTYGTEGQILKGKGLFLCSVGLKFDHPILKTPINVSINPPYKFESLLAREQRRWEKHHQTN